MSEVFAQVSEDSRRSGRFSVNRLLDDMQTERDQLINEKRIIEFKLTEIEDWKRLETSRILGKRLSKTVSIELTARLESEVRIKKSSLMQEKLAVESRLHDLKSKFSRTRRMPDIKPPREDVIVLLRIEKLLMELLSRTNSNSGH